MCKPQFRIYLISLVMFVGCWDMPGLALAAEAESVVTQKSTSETSPTRWTNFLPYAPAVNEYQFELGGMWEADNLYWIGLTYGHHIGRCVFSESPTCQQYVDITGGAGSREAYTDGLVLVGVRWQYVSFPNPYSPSLKLFTGAMNIRDNERDRQVGVYGLGLGFTTTLHKKLDVKWENRIGGGDQFWAQSMISISLKIDDWVDDFGSKMKDFGAATGDVIKSTISAPKNFIDWFERSE